MPLAFLVATACGHPDPVDQVTTWCPDSPPTVPDLVSLEPRGDANVTILDGERSSFILDAWLHPEGALTIEEDECSGAAVPDDGCSIRIRHAGETGADTGTSSFVTAASLLIEHGDDPYWGNGYLAIPVVVKR